MRVLADTYLHIMRNAVAARYTDEPSPTDALLLNALDEVMARGRGGPVSIDAMRHDVTALIERAQATAPDLLLHHAKAIAALSEPGATDIDPAVYFRSALALFSAIADALGEPGLLHRDHLVLIGEFATWEEKILRSKKDAGPSADTAKPDDLSAQLLQQFLATELPQDAQPKVTAFAEIMGGMSKRAFRAAIESAGRGREDVIIKKSEKDPPVALDCMAIRREYKVLKAVRNAGLLAPEPLWLGCDVPGAGGDFYVMRQSPGICSTTILSADSPISRDVLLQIAEQMARLHTAPLDKLDEIVAELGPELASMTADQAVAWRLEQWRLAWRGLDLLPSPLENYIFSWLKANIPANPARPSLIHGDLTPHNCLWDGDRLTAVLDWECAHFGDPAEDMAYAKPLIEQRMDWAEFVAHYEAHGGPKIPEQAMAYHGCYLNMRSVVLANLYVADPQGADLRPLIVDTDFCGLFVDICMSGIRRFEALECR